MKALTLTQPWAAMVAIGAKRIETRSWSTKYRGPLLIHAAAGLGPVGGWKGLRDLTASQPFKDALEDGVARGLVPAYDDDLPFGAIVAQANLIRIVETDDLRIDGRTSVITGLGIETWYLSDQERAFGDYTPGRFAWLLADARPLATPIPAKGALGLWEWQGVLP